MNRTYIKTIPCIIAGLLCWFAPVYSQDTIQLISLPEFSVSEKLDVMFSEINTQKVDSSVIANNNTNDLSSLLSKNSAVTIRAYGVTGISSVSMRGGNANHTAVLWNGFNIQDPLLGSYNFSSSTTNFVDEVNIQYGGGSTAYGSGAVGGTIHLNNKPIFNNPFFASISYKTGSFGLNAVTTELGHGGRKMATRLRLFTNGTKNNFEFQNIAKIGKPIDKYANAQTKQYGALYEIYYKIKTDQVLSSHVWYQNNFREIPANITVSSLENSEENQKDDWLRWGLNWDKTGTKINYEARTGLFYNRSKYTNSTLDLISVNNSLKNTSEVLATINFFEHQKTTFGINNNYTVGISENFSSTPTLNTTALYCAPGFQILKKITLNTSFRDEYYNNEFKPLTYGFNVKYLFYKNLYLSSSFSRNYRTPTFNDLYWNGGFARGNKDLKDETGYSKDVGLGITRNGNKMEIQSAISFYHNIINNQIQWIAEGQTWTPKNVKRVETKGVEFSMRSTYLFSKELKFIFNLTYAYTDAQVKEKSPNESDEVLNKQLIYIPYYQANSLMGIEYKKVSLNVGLQYVGYQFTRADNLEWIQPYLLTNIGAQYIIKQKKYHWVLFGQINNVFNTIYEVRQWYPMPKLNYETGIKLLIK